jgi:hypothetical protein
MSIVAFIIGFIAMLFLGVLVIAPFMLSSDISRKEEKENDDVNP